MNGSARDARPGGRAAARRCDAVSARPRVLVIAEAANPDWVSVPLIGWSLSEALREVADVHLVTQVRNREAILARGRVEGVDFTAIDSERIAAPAHRLASVLRLGANRGWTVVSAIQSLTYPYFERLVWKAFGPAIRRGDFDLVHRVTPLSPTANSLLAGRCARAGVPFLLGPLNGGVPWPAEFAEVRRREREWLSNLRGAFRLGRGRSEMLRNAAAVIAGSRHAVEELPDEVQRRVVYIPENAIEPERFDGRAAAPEPPPLRACFVGRLVPYKGCDMVLEAAAEPMRRGGLVLDVVGDGPESEALKAQAARLGVGDAVDFHGWVPHDRVQSILRRAHLLTFPSIREFGGGVVLEAMALGVVPVVADYGGPAELVDDSTGYRVAMGSRSELVASLRATLDEIASDPGALRNKANAGHERVRAAFTWDAKARQIREVYDWVLAPGGPPPRPLQRPWNSDKI